MHLVVQEVATMSILIFEWPVKPFLLSLKSLMSHLVYLTEYVYNLRRKRVGQPDDKREGNASAPIEAHQVR